MRQNPTKVTSLNDWPGWIWIKRRVIILGLHSQLQKAPRASDSPAAGSEEVRQKIIHPKTPIMPLGRRNKAENGYLKYALQRFHSRQLHIGQTGSRLCSVVLPKATIWSASCLRLCRGFICLLTGFCVELLLDWDEKTEKTFFIFGFLSEPGERRPFSQTRFKKIELAARAHRSGRSESLNACWVNCVSVQIPSYSHFLYKWALIQLERRPSRPGQPPSLRCSFCCWLRKGQRFTHTNWNELEIFSFMIPL